MAAMSSSSWALEPGLGAFVRTGEGVRVKRVAFVDVKVYAITHEMKALPATRSRAAAVAAETDKKFTLRMLRDVDAQKIREALRDAYLVNGFTDGKKIGVFLAAIGKDLREGSYLTFFYDAAAQTTTLTAQGSGSATIEGADFMRATWSIWLGKIDQPALGEALVAKIR